MVKIKIEEIRDDFKLYYNNLPKAELRVQELMVDISKNDLENPIDVHKIEGEYEIIEGVHRLEALRRLGWKEIPCNIINHGPQPSPFPRGGDR